MQGFHHRGEFDPPEWANNLKNYYWYIRVEGRDKAKRRRYYRLISKEKLRLSEQYIDQKLIAATCRYLCSLKKNDGKAMIAYMQEPVIQLSLSFW